MDDDRGVADEQQRKVERRDAGDRPERHAADVRLPLLGARQPVERNDLAVDPLGLFRRDAEHEGGAVDLEPRRPDRLPGFARDDAGEFLAAAGDRRRDRGQDGLALPRRDQPGRRERPDRAGNRPLDLRRTRVVHGRHRSAVERAAHLEGGPGPHRFAVHEDAEFHPPILACAQNGGASRPNAPPRRTTISTASSRYAVPHSDGSNFPTPESGLTRGSDSTAQSTPPVSAAQASGEAAASMIARKWLPGYACRRESWNTSAGGYSSHVTNPTRFLPAQTGPSSPRARANSMAGREKIAGGMSASAAASRLRTRSWMGTRAKSGAAASGATAGPRRMTRDDKSSSRQRATSGADTRNRSGVRRR